MTCDYCYDDPHNERCIMTGKVCMNEDENCKGEIGFHSTGRGKSYPRCNYHFEERMKREAHICELESPFRPAWFDPANAGERWDTEDP